MPHLIRVRLRVNALDASGHRGTPACRFREGLEREAVALDGPPLGAFPASRALTRAGEMNWLFAGDAAFDAGQVERAEVADIAAGIGT